MVQWTEKELMSIVSHISAVNLEFKPENIMHKNLMNQDFEESFEEIKNYKYCGILFLHPYLTRLFGMLGLLENKTFVKLNARIRAAQLLFYLVNFDRKAEEEDFNFFKLILEIDKDILFP